jgi:hypothetical protein
LAQKNRQKNTRNQDIYFDNLTKKDKTYAPNEHVKKISQKMRFVIRLNNQEYEIIKLRAAVLGYKTMSAMIRERLLKNNTTTEKQIREIHNKLIQNGKK